MAASTSDWLGYAMLGWVQAILIGIAFFMFRRGATHPRLTPYSKPSAGAPLHTLRHRDTCAMAATLYSYFIVALCYRLDGGRVVRWSIGLWFDEG